MKRVVLVHGWEGRSDLGWFKWLREELEKRGFEVIAPDMPEADDPKIELWVPHLSKVIPDPDKDTYFIGHSMGCQAVLRYLQDIDTEVGGVVLVAGFIEPGSLTGVEDEEDIEMARPCLRSFA
jgi:predicted alpha/beta hydrolase family esterase